MLLLLLFFNIIILIYLNKLIVKSFPLDRAISIRYINKRLHAFACYKRGRGDRRRRRREKGSTHHTHTRCRAPRSGTEQASVRAWEAVSSLERRLGTTTGMGQTNRLALASRESPEVTRGDPRSLTVHQRRTFALVPRITTDVDRRSIAPGDIVRISILETSAPQRARSFLINVNDWQSILAFDIQLETKKRHLSVL